MAFNEAKCHVMHIGQHNPGHLYMMNGIRLETSDKERDIRVTISSNLKPAQQCKKAAQMTSTALAQITCLFHFQDRHVFLSLKTIRAAPTGVCHGCLVALDLGGHSVP